MEIVRARETDLEAVLDVYGHARAYMRAHGNAEQWRDGYPSRELVQGDIADGNLYLCVEDGVICGVFFYRFGADPTYEQIDGAWLNDRPYGVIHRIAVAQHRRGVAGFCFETCFSWCQNLKIDTAHENLPMQRALAKHGFTPCGRIYLENGDERIAFQRECGKTV
ncbi:MAG: GNAT family N-acetyltransferase [Clostridia bacterium]|nr:GNAT family N-acetyltransferase [Clostridia bacterium]